MRYPFILKICLFAALSYSHAGNLIPFVLPWDDDSTGITDLSHYNHTPAGKHGYIEVDDQAHFVAGGERLRFWGVNVTAGSCFPTHSEAEAIAGRLAKFGFNIVRFHHMDNHWGGASLIDYSQGNSRSLDLENLEKLDYFIAQLKSKGIYSNLNLINSRAFMPSDGLDADLGDLELKEIHVLGFIDNTFRNLEKEYASKLLTHVNPYTDLSYAKDPAVAVVEINNENGIFQQFFEGSLSRWPLAYKNQLQTKWNEWLASKYASTEELLSAWSGASAALGNQLLVNSNFSNGSNPWTTFQSAPASITSSTGEFEGRQSLKIEVASASSVNWHSQLNQAGLELTKGNIYTFSFWVRAEPARSLNANITYAGGTDGFTAIHTFQEIAVTSDWVKHSFTFESAISSDNLRVSFNNFASQESPFYFSDIELQEGGSLAAKLPEGQTIESANIESNSHIGSYEPKRKIDWTRFLSQIAKEYWTDMGDYIENDLEYQGLVNGTTIMNSTPNIQGDAGFDLVDTHAYWQHPSGNPFGGGDWAVQPVSIVNSLENSISGLSMQRVDGFPHTVTEYSHSFPNPFASEGPLIIGAYAALQDWDGIYFFDYAKGNSWDQGFWNGFFSINNHPGALANALIGANLFRRADVSAAQQQVLMNFNPEREAELVATRGRVWNVGDGRQLDIPSEHFTRNRVALSIGEEAQGIEAAPPAAPEGPTYSSDTQQLSWDLSVPDRGVVTINTTKTLGMLGYINGRSFGSNDIEISIGEMQEDWASLMITLKTGSFSEPDGASQMLVVASGINENTNMQWIDETKQSVASNWGESPSLIESVPATITLPYSAGRVKAWSLDDSGQREDALEISTDEQNRTHLEIGTNQASLWYEIQVAPIIDPYLTWKQEHFDPQERNDGLISGPNADPDSDSISNIFEFFAGYNPQVRDPDFPIDFQIKWIESLPVQIFEFPFPIDYPTAQLFLEFSHNLIDWTKISLENPSIIVTVNDHSINRDALKVQFTPPTFPSFSRIGSN